MADEPSVLTCWKDIATYLGKTVRTVQRWERELGMPVHRPRGPNAKVVCALPEELAQWIAKASLEPEPGAPPSPEQVSLLLARLETLIAENDSLARRCAAMLHALESGRSRLTAAAVDASRLVAEWTPSPASSSNGSGHNVVQLVSNNGHPKRAGHSKRKEA